MVIVSSAGSVLLECLLAMDFKIIWSLSSSLKLFLVLFLVFSLKAVTTRTQQKKQICMNSFIGLLSRQEHIKTKNRQESHNKDGVYIGNVAYLIVYFGRKSIGRHPWYSEMFWW